MKGFVEMWKEALKIKGVGKALGKYALGLGGMVAGLWFMLEGYGEFDSAFVNDAWRKSLSTGNGLTDEEREAVITCLTAAREKRNEELKAEAEELLSKVHEV